MSIGINNSLSNLSSVYKYNKLQNTQNVFKNQLIQNEQGANKIVSNVSNAKYGQNDALTLIEDKKVYESQKHHRDLCNIEFGSKEWGEWKIKHNRNFFPPLDAPAEVRKAFREIKESIPKDDEKAQQDFRFECAHLLFMADRPDLAGMQGEFKLETSRDYEQLLNFNIIKNNTFADMVKDPKDKEYFNKSAKISQNLKNKLREVLFGI